ncbi:tRNA(fMet)-specific endonuclease VapC [Rhizobium sp. BK650]|uniref:type II toxin-antitoxin system VapC family toxin n=1 Tax=Rhizobium sp. BK650 TaxID=2586990 RepID=UPI00182F83D1|nr:tRNA(fMet)-specific endonuclease VapC [Rhizobium sp. BK650]
MRYLIDTNALISLVAGRSEQLARRILASNEGEIGLSSIVLHELYYGAYKSRKVAFNLETIRLLAQDFPLLVFDEQDANAAGEIRAGLAATGQPIGPFDALIAAQAKARRLTVITNNVKEFGRIAGLSVEDWTE